MGRGTVGLVRSWWVTKTAEQVEERRRLLAQPRPSRTTTLVFVGAMVTMFAGVLVFFVLGSRSMWLYVAMFISSSVVILIAEVEHRRNRVRSER